ncbi:MAG: aminoacyltransferase [Tabrizicola sp.]|nr:aminoacyltransferase [Tabrizicola sp.]
MTDAPLSVRAVDASEWPTISARFRDLSFEQSLTYGTAAAGRIGGRMICLVIERDGKVLSAALVRVKALPLLGRGIAWVASGPLMQRIGLSDPSEEEVAAILQALRAEVSGRMGHILRFRLAGIGLYDGEATARIAAASGYVPTDRAVAYRSIAIDLDHTEAELMGRLDGKWRTDLRYALKSELTVECGNTPDLAARFLKLFDDIQVAKGFRPDVTPEFHFALSGPDLSHDILLVTKDGQDLAGIVIGTTGRTVIYLYGATADAGRRLRAGYLLTWEGIRLARSRGMRWYDLGGVDFDGNPDVARFKQRMNGVTIVGAGPFEATASGPVFTLIRGLEQVRGALRRRKGKG